MNVDGAVSNRTTLPPPESPFKGKIETAMKDSTPLRTLVK